MGGLGSLGPDALTRSQTFPWSPSHASLRLAVGSLRMIFLHFEA